jgi:hypothetical protein
VVDVDSTLKHHGDTLTVQGILKHLPTVELSVFNLLEEELCQPFTPENGMVIQEGILLLAREFRVQAFGLVYVDRMSVDNRIPLEDVDMVQRVWTQRAVMAVQWNNKEFRIWHWPSGLRTIVLRLARVALDRYFQGFATSTGPSEPSFHTSGDVLLHLGLN